CHVSFSVTLRCSPPRTSPSFPSTTLFRSHNYGGTIGGPIFKNRTFFFFDYDGLTQTGLDTTRAGVPSDAERAGDFGELCAANGGDRKSTRLNSSHEWNSYAVFCLKKKKKK